MTQSSVLDLAKIDPELDEILKKTPFVGGLDANTDIPALRARLVAMKKSLTDANTSSQEEVTVIEQDRQIPTRDGAEITVRIYSPKSPPTDGSPCFVVYHGGGFCLGGLDNEALLCRKWTDHFGGVTVNVDYRLAPENPFPVPVNDAYDALKWTAAHLDDLKVNPTKGFVVGGVSAGANFTAVVSHLYRDEKLSPPLTGLYLSIPSVLGPQMVPEKYKADYLSREQNKDAPILNQDSLTLFRNLYKEDPTSPLMTPFLWPTGHQGLPPTYFQICGMDPLRDEGIIYERVLREECGVKTHVDMFPGLPHGFWSWWPQANFSKKFQRDSVNGLAWLLDQKA